jgi:alpha-glucosidase (family GH31 glycosyl hydrolase)
MTVPNPRPLLVLIALAAACDSPDTVVVMPDGAADPCVRADLDELPAPELHTARWAFEPWISKDISDRADTYAFVEGFRERGIPVGAVVLDSPWETNYNTFVPNPSRYGDFPSLVSDMHDRGVKVILWITSLVNETSIDFEPGGDFYDGPAPNLEEGLACNYFVNDGEMFVWWKGKGASVDFFNPHARAWWHRQQDIVLDANIDGWKLDFGESYIRRDVLSTFEGEKPHQEYSERYYEDFLAYGRAKRGRDFVTMVRAWDASYDLPGRFFARREHAPVAWMGDNNRDWAGLEDALDHMFVSARAGYPVLGSDIGGYLDRDDQNLLGPQIPFDTLNFARWIAVGALSPFMQLHGRANLEPWSVPDHVDETVAVYRYWATFHHALVPFLYSLSEEAWAAGTSLVEPIGEPAEWKGDYRYLLGGAFLVAPILDETGKRAVPLPSGARWYDWWTGAVHEGGTTVAADVSGDRIESPLYVREGAIVPITVDDAVLGLGAPDAEARTVMAWPASEKTTFRLREDDDSTTTLELQQLAGGEAELSISASPRKLVLRIRAEDEPSAVRENDVPVTKHATIAELEASGSGWAYDAASKTAIVHAPARGPAPLRIALAP